MFCLCPPRVCLPSPVEFLQSNPTWHALEKEIATYYSIFTWKIPGTEKPGEWPSMVSHGVGYDCSNLAAAAAAFKIKFPGSSQFLWQIPRLGNPLWDPKLLQQWDNFFYIIVLQIVGHQLVDSMVGLMETSFKMIYATGSTPRSVEIRVPIPMAGYCWSMPLQETLKYSEVALAHSLCGLWELVCTSFCLIPLSISGSHGVWFYMQFCPSYYLVGSFALLLVMSYLILVGSNFLLSMVVQQ